MNLYCPEECVLSREVDCVWPLIAPLVILGTADDGKNSCCYGRVKLLVVNPVGGVCTLGSF